MEGHGQAGSPAASPAISQPVHQRFGPGSSDRSAAGSGTSAEPPHGTSSSQLAQPPHLQCEVEQGALGGRQESPTPQGNTCQPKAGACMRCKNYRNVLLWLRNFRKSEERQQRCSHTAPSSREHCATGVSPLCAGWLRVSAHLRTLAPASSEQHTGVCSVHVFAPVLHPQPGWPHVQQVLHSQMHLSGFQTPGNRYKDVHVNTAPAYCTFDQKNVMEEKSSVGTHLLLISFIQQGNFITKDPACDLLRQTNKQTDLKGAAHVS